MSESEGKFSPDPDLAEQCLVHGQLKQRAMGFCRERGDEHKCPLWRVQIVPS